MKKAILAAMLLAAMAVAAEAQSSPYRRSRGISGPVHRYSRSITGTAYGYSRSGYYPTAGGSLYAGYGPLYYGAHPVLPRYYNHSGFYFPGFFGGYWGPDFGYVPPGEGGYGYPAYRRAYLAAGLSPDYSPAWASRRGVADRSYEDRASREVADGRRLIREGRYADALDRLRSAVVTHTGSGHVQAWFAIGLAAAGDAPNADKALRSASKTGGVGKPSIDGLFKDGKEEAKVLQRFGPGTLVGAWLRSLKGDAGPLKKLGETTPEAKNLLKD